MIILENIKKILDPRDVGKVQHSLSTIVFTALCGVLAGCELAWNKRLLQDKERLAFTLCKF